MIRLALTFLIGLSAVTAASEDLHEQIIGEWHYDGFYYEGKRFTRPNPDLQVVFEFHADGTNRLYWHRSDDGTFCERKGEWHLDGDQLTQKATWINPKNHSSCAQDPDMRPDRTTQNRIHIRDEELGLHMDLNGKDFVYVLKRAQP